MTTVHDSEVLLQVEDLTVGFPTEDGLVQAVRGVTYEVRRGDSVGIVGESGSGKSVTSLAIMGLLPRSAKVSGSVRLMGDEILGLGDAEMSKLRGNKVAMIFQDPLTSLNPVYTVGVQIAEAIQAHHDISKKRALDRATELLDIVGIPNPKARVNSYPHEMSGGMRQRVVIAIAMANSPELIIADEPTTALDVTVQAQVLEALEAARKETGAALVLITHDLGVIAGHTDRVCVMYAGKMVETGTVDEIFYQPRMPYTLGLLGSLPRIDETGRQRLTPITGSPPSLVSLSPGCPFMPRCPMSRDRCAEDEPVLTPTTVPGHRSACHFHAELTAVSAEDVFSTESTDDADVVPTAETAATETAAAETPVNEIVATEASVKDIPAENATVKDVPVKDSAVKDTAAADAPASEEAPAGEATATEAEAKVPAAETVKTAADAKPVDTAATEVPE